MVKVGDIIEVRQIKGITGGCRISVIVTDINPPDGEHFTGRVLEILLRGDCHGAVNDDYPCHDTELRRCDWGFDHDDIAGILPDAAGMHLG